MFFLDYAPRFSSLEELFAQLGCQDGKAMGDMIVQGRVRARLAHARE